MHNTINSIIILVSLCCLYVEEVSAYDFVYVSGPATFVQATAGCRNIGREMVSIHNTAEQQEVIDLCSVGRWSCWLGGKRQVNDIEFEWIDGTIWDFDDWMGSSPGQPLHLAACIIQSGSWYDVPCNAGYGRHQSYVCGPPISTTTTSNPTNPPTPSPTLDTLVTSSTSLSFEQCIIKFEGGNDSTEFLNNLEWIKVNGELPGVDSTSGYYFMADNYYLYTLTNCRDNVNANWWIIVDVDDNIFNNSNKPPCDVAIGRCKRKNLKDCDGNWLFKNIDGHGHTKNIHFQILSMDEIC